MPAWFTGSVVPTPAPPTTALRRIPAAVLVLALVAASLVLVAVGRNVWQRLERDPSRDGHRRVLFVGDSLMFGASGLLELKFRSQDIETRFVGGYGSGLLSGQGWWVRELGYQVDTWHPDVVVIEACCNYGVGEPLFRAPDGSTVTSESDDMYRWWKHQAEAAVAEATRYGADVFWVVTPAASEQLWPTYVERIPKFNEISAGLGVDRIDWRQVLTPDGTFTPTKEIDGKTVRIRDPDGLHLADAGDDLVVRATYDAVAPALGVG